jgi:hypothetical protein
MVSTPKKTLGGRLIPPPREYLRSSQSSNSLTHPCPMHPHDTYSECRDKKRGGGRSWKLVFGKSPSTAEEGRPFDRTFERIPLASLLACHALPLCRPEAYTTCKVDMWYLSVPSKRSSMQASQKVWAPERVLCSAPMKQKRTRSVRQKHREREGVEVRVLQVFCAQERARTREKTQNEHTAAGCSGGDCLYQRQTAATLRQRERPGVGERTCGKAHERSARETKSQSLPQNAPRHACVPLQLGVVSWGAS